MNEEAGKALQGRPDKAEIVADWCRKNPNGTKADCIRETGLSKPTVYKWWFYDIERELEKECVEYMEQKKLCDEIREFLKKEEELMPDLMFDID